VEKMTIDEILESLSISSAVFTPFRNAKQVPIFDAPE